MKKLSTKFVVFYATNIYSFLQLIYFKTVINDEINFTLLKKITQNLITTFPQKNWSTIADNRERLTILEQLCTILTVKKV